MSALIHTDDLPAGDRFEFWRGAVSETWVPMECHTDDEGAFWAQLRSGGLGAVTVNLMTAAPHGVRRTPRLIRRSDPDLLKVFVLLRGNCVISQDDLIDLVDQRAPDGFAELDEVASHAELEAIVRGYSRTAGFDQAQVNR